MEINQKNIWNLVGSLICWRLILPNEELTQFIIIILLSVLSTYCLSDCKNSK